MVLMFPLLKENVLSNGSNGMITALVRWNCACTKIPDVLSPLTISSGELWSKLFVPQRMKIQRMKIQDKVEFKGNFSFFTLHNKFWILSSERPKFSVLCLEKYSDQTSWYLFMLDIKDSPINKIFEGDSFCKNLCSQKFLYQTRLLFLGAGIKYFNISISDIGCVTIVIYYLQPFNM